MTQALHSLRGIPDILPTEVRRWQALEKLWQHLMVLYGYQEIRLPVIEPLALFKRSIGEATDVVEKEMFIVAHHSEDMALRPEGTAGCVRAGIQHNLFRQTQKFWYLGPMFRYERPQLGRQRQFYQLGLEAFGFDGTLIEIEHLLLVQRFFQELDLLEACTLEINSLGSHTERLEYKQALIAYLTQHAAHLDPDSQRRLTTNPLRILDSKNQTTQEILAHSPSILDFLGPESRVQLESLEEHLTHQEISYTLNPHLVRGLDYYNNLVYEWTTTRLGAQATVCAGGRFDTLVQTLGYKEQVPAVGLAMGFERLLLLTTETLVHSPPCDVYMVLVGDIKDNRAVHLAEHLRTHNISVYLNGHGGSLKTQLKRANRLDATVAVIFGEDECAKNQVTLKSLRQDIPQMTLAIPEALSQIQKLIGAPL